MKHSQSTPQLCPPKFDGLSKNVTQKQRKLQIATFNKPLMPCPSTWETETSAKLGKGEYHENYEYLDNALNKANFIKKENEKIMFSKARRHLHDLAEMKFGFVANMFKMFDFD